MMYIYLARAPYFDQDGGRLYKIGIGKSVPKRMKSLSSSGVSGEFQHLFSRRVDDAKGCESCVFKTLSFYRYINNREIFSFTSDTEAVACVEEAVAYHQEGTEVASETRLPEELLLQLEDRWYDEECVI